MEITDRVIGRFRGHENGPLLIVIGGLHGNEVAGVKAIRSMLKMLEVEPLTNPDFSYRGNFLGLAGNLAALQQGKRYIEKDINRAFHKTTVDLILATDPQDLRNEDKEIYLLINTIKKEIQACNAEKVYLLDLHTTTAHGGIFTIPSESYESIRIGQKLNAPVILGFMKSLSGTTLQYFTEETLGVSTTAITFEAGQHHDGLSVKRAISCIAGLMRSINSVKESDVESHHDELLLKYAAGLPKMAELVYTHHVKEGDGFAMEPGFHNFDKVKSGALLARDNKGEIRASEDGMILMPLYQAQGEDGYFLIREVTSTELNRTRHDMEQRVH